MLVDVVVLVRLILERRRRHQRIWSIPMSPSRSVAEIAKATTEARFLSPWVAYLPASSTVPSPRAFWGRIPGAPGELVDSAKAYAYSRRALAAASPRVRVFTIGRSEEGRDILLLAIADEKGIENLDALKAANASLADPRTLDAAAAQPLDRRLAAFSITSTPRCIRTKPGSTESRCSNWPTGSPCRSSQ